MTRTWQRESVVAPTQADFRVEGRSKPTQTIEAIRVSTHAGHRLVDIVAARNPAVTPYASNGLSFMVLEGGSTKTGCGVVLGSFIY